MTCPKCKGKTNISTERRPNGDSICGNCAYKGASVTFRPDGPNFVQINRVEYVLKSDYDILKSALGYIHAKSMLASLQGNDLQAAVDYIYKTATEAIKEVQ